MTGNVNNLIKSLKSVDAVGIILPNGWFGRPYDNFLTINEVTCHDNLMSIKLEDGRIKMNISFPKDIDITDSNITIKNFAFCIFEWQEYGNDKKNKDEYNKGPVNFVARPLTHFNT